MPPLTRLRSRLAGRDVWNIHGDNLLYLGPVVASAWGERHVGMLWPRAATIMAACIQMFDAGSLADPKRFSPNFGCMRSLARIDDPR